MTFSVTSRQNGRVIPTRGVHPLTLVMGVTLWLLVLLGAGATRAEIADRSWERFSVTLRSGAVSSEPLQMVTDLNHRDARALLRELERFAALVDLFAAPYVPLGDEIAPALKRRTAGVDESDTLQLLVMRRRRDFDRLFHAGHFAAFTVPTLDKTVLVVGPVGGRVSLRENLFHEYVHYRLRRDVPGGLPLWFEEGLASFLSQARFSRWLPQDDPTSEGSVPMDRYELGRWGPEGLGPDTSLQRLVERRDLHGMRRQHIYGFYRTSHAFVRHLYIDANVDPNALARSLVLGTPEFPQGLGVDLRTAGKAIRRLSRRNPGGRDLRGQMSTGAPEKRLLKGRFVAQTEPMAIQQTSLETWEAREFLAEAALLVNPQASQRLFARAVSEHPERLSALLGHAQSLRLQAQPEAAKTALAEALALAPTHPDVVVEQAALRTNGCIVRRTEGCDRYWQEAAEELRTVLDAEPDNYEAIYRLGLALLFLGRPGEALGYLEISWQRVPWSPRVNFFMGEAMRLLGDTRAHWYLSNASRWASSQFFKDSSRAALRLLAAGEQASGGT